MYFLKPFFESLFSSTPANMYLYDYALSDNSCRLFIDFPGDLWLRETFFDISQENTTFSIHVSDHTPSCDTPFRLSWLLFQLGADIQSRLADYVSLFFPAHGFVCQNNLPLPNQPAPPSFLRLLVPAAKTPLRTSVTGCMLSAVMLCFTWFQLLFDYTGEKEFLLLSYFLSLNSWFFFFFLWKLTRPFFEQLLDWSFTKSIQK